MEIITKALSGVYYTGEAVPICLRSRRELISTATAVAVFSLGWVREVYPACPARIWFSGRVSPLGLPRPTTQSCQCDYVVVIAKEHSGVYYTGEAVPICLRSRRELISTATAVAVFSLVRVREGHPSHRARIAIAGRVSPLELRASHADGML